MTTQIEPASDTQADSPTIDNSPEGHQNALTSLARAHRLWSQAWAACVAVVTTNLTQDTPAAQRMEYLLRALLTDCIAWTCDGAPLGLFELAQQNVRNIVGSAEHAQDMEHYREAVQLDIRQHQPGDPSVQRDETYRVLAQYRERMSPRARELLQAVIGRENHGPDGEGAPPTPDVLVRVLVLEESWAASDAQAVYDCCCKLVN